MIFKVFPGAIANTKGPFRKGGKLRARCFLSALVMWHRAPAFLQWVTSPRALPHFKYAAIRAVARGTVNMQWFELATIWVAPSIDLDFENGFFQKVS